MQVGRIGVIVLFVVSVSLWVARPGIVLAVSLAAIVALVWPYLRDSRRLGRPAPPRAVTTADVATIDLVYEHERGDSLRAEIARAARLDPGARKNAVCQALLSTDGLTHVAIRNWPERDFDAGMRTYQEIRRDIYARCGIKPQPDLGSGYRGDPESQDMREPRFVLVSLSLISTVELPEPLGTQREAAQEMLARIASMNMTDILASNVDVFPTSPGEAWSEAELIARIHRLQAVRSHDPVANVATKARTQRGW